MSNFANHQRDALVGTEVETLPGVILGHVNIPVICVGSYIHDGCYPMVASAHISISRYQFPRIIRSFYRKTVAHSFLLVKVVFIWKIMHIASSYNGISLVNQIRGVI